MLALKTLLAHAGIPQARLARACGISPATLSQLINHDKWPTKPDSQTLQQRIVQMLGDTGATQNYNADQLTALFLPRPTATTAGPAQQPPLTPLTKETITMLLRKTTLSAAAKKHFNLFRDPFSDDLNDAADVYTGSPSIRDVREYMWQTAKGTGFLAVYGESGSGKTTLRLDLIDRIQQQQAPIILIEPYVLGMEDNDLKGKTLKSSSIIDAIIRTVAPTEKPYSSMEAKSRQLHRILTDSKKSGFNHCLIIEEAHALSIPTLKHLKRFLELQIGFKKLLSIILIGQTELKNKLNERSPEIREVVQRCELMQLEPLNAHLEDYLRFKFARIGIENPEQIFDKTAYDGIRRRLIFSKPAKNSAHTESLMYPLMIHNLITSALNAAATIGAPKVCRDLILEA